MSRLILTILFSISIFYSVLAQQYSVSGRIINTNDKKAIEFASVILSESEQWSVSDKNGEFTINNVPAGKTILVAQTLGYVRAVVELNVDKDISDLVIEMSENNLSLNEVVVTAKRNKSELTTSYILDRNTLDHAQLLNMSDISTLLPGGKSKATINLATEDDRLSLRGGGTERGNPSFGTAIEIDGVRLDNNSQMSAGSTGGITPSSETKGASTRNVSTVNIESIEVVTGIASVEYGDMSNGIVKVNTRKGKTPFYIEASTHPHTKQFALSKGFSLGSNVGVLNTSLEHAKSNADIASPYTTYERNALSLNYNKTFGAGSDNPLNLEVGFTGNIGGFDKKSDPDLLLNEFEKAKDNTARGHFKLNWLLNRPWITNLEFSGSMSYSSRTKKKNLRKSIGDEMKQEIIHGTEEGYFLSTTYDENPNAPVLLSPSGYWDEIIHTDNKPVVYTLKAKADWRRRFGNISNKVMLGIEYKRSGNKGRGVYYDDMRYADTWREYRYDKLPFMNNIAAYAEDRLSVPVRNGKSTLEVVAGLRADITSLGESEYGTVGSISPRASAKYTFWKKSDNAVKDLSVSLGWGKSVKLPSFEVLYPRPTYIDMLSFSTRDSKKENLYGFYIMPIQSAYNPNLKWQYSNQAEIGVEANILGANIMLSGYYNKTVNPYISVNQYAPFTFAVTKENAIGGNFPIAEDNREFTMDKTTGVITVSDKTGANSSVQLAQVTQDRFKSLSMYDNGSDVKRMGLDWAIDFPQIQALRTKFRLDGNYYYYKGVEENLYAYIQDINTEVSGGAGYPRVIGFYAGATGTVNNSIVSNGSLSRELNTNLTITTHIPKIRLIISMRIEGSLYNYSRRLSEYKGQSRSFVSEASDTDFLNTSNTDIYKGNNKAAVYPLYYSTWDDPNTKIPFADKYLWAKENDPELFAQLKNLVIESSTKTLFNPDRISSYFSANLSVTKEIGKYATISFYANNFINSMRKVKSSSEDTHISLYGSGMIPTFYYGLTLKLEI